MLTILLIALGIFFSVGVLTGIIGLFATYENAVPINITIIVIFGLPALACFWFAKRRSARA